MSEATHPGPNDGINELCPVGHYCEQGETGDQKGPQLTLLTFYDNEAADKICDLLNMDF